MKNVSLSHIDLELNKILSEYADDVKGAVIESVRKTGEAAKNKLRQTSPKRTGAYRKGWRTTELSVSPFGGEIKVHNKTRYMLTHLLEYGHANRNGGRTPAYVHLAPVRKEAEDMLEKITKGLIQDI